MKTLLLIPSVVKKGLGADVAADRHPRMDYDALADALTAGPDDQADILDYGVVDAERSWVIRLTRRCAGRDAALALLGFARRRAYDALFTNSENVGIPLALLLNPTPRRPTHVTIGHRLSTGKKRIFFQWLKAHRQMDTIFVYAQTQREFAEQRLGIPAPRLRRIAFHADERFYRPQLDAPTHENQVCSAGLEWRDYPTLLEAVVDAPDLSVKLAAASPWSKHKNETADCPLPPNVEARRYDYGELRDLYAQSGFAVVPLYENDFQAGVTTLLEVMAMGKAVIVTQTTGQTDVIEDGKNGLTVAPGDVADWRRAIARLQGDPALRERLGRNARHWVEQQASLNHWVAQMTQALHGSPQIVPSSRVEEKAITQGA